MHCDLCCRIGVSILLCLVYVQQYKSFIFLSIWCKSSLLFLFLCRWCFDVEIVYLCKHLNIPMVEVSVNWTEIPGSKVRLTSIMHMLFELVLIRLGYGLGIWKVYTWLTYCYRLERGLKPYSVRNRRYTHESGTRDIGRAEFFSMQSLRSLYK